MYDPSTNFKRVNFNRKLTSFKFFESSFNDIFVCVLISTELNIDSITNSK